MLGNSAVTDWIGLTWLRIGTSGRGSCEHNNEHSGFINFINFLSTCTIGVSLRRIQLHGLMVQLLIIGECGYLQCALFPILRTWTISLPCLGILTNINSIEQNHYCWPNNPQIIQSDCAVACSQEPANGPYPQPVESNPHSYNIFHKIYVSVFGAGLWTALLIPVTGGPPLTCLPPLFLPHMVCFWDL
jgi:hypothetical protein